MGYTTDEVYKIKYANVWSCDWFKSGTKRVLNGARKCIEKEGDWNVFVEIAEFLSELQCNLQ